MAKARVLLSIEPELYDEIIKRAKSRFMSIQEHLLDLARRDVLRKR